MGDRALRQSLSFFRKGDIHHVPTRIRQMELGPVVKRFYLIGQILFDSILWPDVYYQTQNLGLVSSGREHSLTTSTRTGRGSMGWCPGGSQRRCSTALQTGHGWSLPHQAGGEGIQELWSQLQGRGEGDLLELVLYYEKNSLYKKVKLKTAVTEELLATWGILGGGMVTIGKVSLYCSTGCMDPNTFNSKLCTTTRLGGRMSSFCECEPTEGWLVEVGLSTANFTQVEDGGRGDDKSENPPLGSLQKGSIDIVGSEVELVDRPSGVVGIMIEIGNELRCAIREEVLDKSHSDFVQIWSRRIIKLFYMEIFAHLFLFHYYSSFISKGQGPSCNFSFA
jgi:hypothetical protein